MGSSNIATPASRSISIVTDTPARVTFNTLLLCAIALSIAASGYHWLRVDIGGLLVHPYLFPISALFPILVLTRLQFIPKRIVISLLVFAGLYYASTFTTGVWVGEGLKIGASVITILAAAMLVRSQTDFAAAVFGLCLAIAFLAVVGLESDDDLSRGIRAIEVANRNAYSLYALPAILLGGYLLLKKHSYPLVLNIIVAACLFVSTLFVFLSLNRSGWIGVLMIGLMLFKDRRIRGLLLAAIVGLGCYIVLSKYYGTEAIEARWSQTWQDISRDHLRVQLIVQSVEIGMQNPLFGVSPQELPKKLGRRFGYSAGLMNAHNVFAHVMAGSGLFCLAALLYVGWVLWRWELKPRGPPDFDPSFLEARKLLRMMIALWVVRGMFSHEILYSPSFCIALGLCIGLCVISTPQVHCAYNGLRRRRIGFARR